MTRITSSLFAASIAVALATTGCKKEEASDPAAAAAAAAGGNQAVAEAIAAKGGSTALPSKVGYAIFPADVQAIIGINVAAARNSGLWKKYEDKLEESISKEMADMKAACGGADPLESAQTVIAGFNKDSEDGVVVIKGIPRAMLKKCAEGSANTDKKVTVKDEGNFSLFTVDGEENWVAWLDDSTAVLAPEKDKAYLEARIAGTDGLAESAPIMALLKNTDTSASLYFAGDIALAGDQAAMAKGAQGFFASLKLTDGFALDAGARFDTAENAKSMTDTVKGQVEMMKGQVPAGFKTLVDKAVIKNAEKDLIVQLTLTGTELDGVIKAAEAMAGAFGGGL